MLVADLSPKEATKRRPSRDHTRRAIWHLRGAMSNEGWDVRCSGCGRLLAKVQDGLLTVQRGDLRATFEGKFRASFICSRPSCGQKNVVLVVSHDDHCPAFTR